MLSSHQTFNTFLNENKVPSLDINALVKLFKNNEKIYVLCGGAPGAGKSYVIEQKFGKNVKNLDMDAYIQRLGGSSKEDYKKNGMNARVLMRKDSDEFLRKGISFIKQGVSAGLPAVINQAKQAKEAGFTIVFFYVDVDLKTALKRNKERVDKGERISLVPEYVIKRKRKDSLDVLAKLSEEHLLFDYIVKYKN